MKNNIFGVGDVLTIILLVVLSWILIHAFALLGIFLAIAYPIWWLLVPSKTVCLLCRAKQEGSKCRFCNKTVVKGEGYSPYGLNSAILNGFLILVCSLVSIGVVYGESKFLANLGFPPTPKTASFMIPSKGQFMLDEVFSMDIEITNMENSINTIQADIGFDSDKIEIVDISTVDSFANIFIQKEINNEAGWARLTGGLPNPGFSGNYGSFGRVYFIGKSPGIAKVEFLNSSMVLANDGRGSNILKDWPSTSYLILPEKVPSEVYEEQKELISRINVLGSTSMENTQLIFFEEPTVLGSQIDEEPNKAIGLDLSAILLGTLEKINTLILDFWGNVFKAVF